tara:strand:- start:229 stop:447 length:219 start_codon:yes stop_codon:yes gene_type:complete
MERIMVDYNLKASTSTNAKTIHARLVKHITFLNKLKTTLENDCVEQGLLEIVVVKEIPVAAHNRKVKERIWK